MEEDELEQEMDEADMLQILAVRTCWSRSHETSFRHFKSLTRRSAGKGSLIRDDEDTDKVTASNVSKHHEGKVDMESGRAALLALFLIYCPSIIAELNLWEERRIGEITGLEVLAEANTYFRDVIDVLHFVFLFQTHTPSAASYPDLCVFVYIYVCVCVVG
jgi:hypothetical protein